MPTLATFPYSFVRSSLGCFVAIFMVTSHLSGDQMGGSVELDVLGDQVHEQVEAAPFVLDSLPSDVRVAARGSSDTFLDSVREKRAADVKPAASLEHEFTMNLNGDIQKPKEQAPDEYGLLPMPNEFSNEGHEFAINTSDRVGVVLSSYDADFSNGMLDSVTEENDPDSKSGKTLPMRPEPSGLSLTLMCLVSLIIIGSCTRILRPLREDPIEIGL